MAGGTLAYFVSIPDETGNVVTFGPGDDVPAWAAKAITNPSAWAEAPEDDGDASGGDPYKGWKKSQFEEEIAKRNDARDDEDQIKVEGSGTVPDLKAALVADDGAGDPS